MVTKITVGFQAAWYGLLYPGAAKGRFFNKNNESHLAKTLWSIAKKRAPEVNSAGKRIGKQERDVG